ncbi:hypothetical protein BaRGS_00012523, partial [Batillaria attramentaria]
MKMTATLTFILFLGCVFASGDASLVKRSDDVLPLEGMVQQQAATIQTLQADLNAVKNRLSTVESGLQKE